MGISIDLGYWKQGDDINHWQNQANGDVVKTLELVILNFEETIKRMKDIIDVMKKYNLDDIDWNAQTHMVTLEGPFEFEQELVDKELGWRDYDDEEDDEDYIQLTPEQAEKMAELHRAMKKANREGK